MMLSISIHILGSINCGKRAIPGRNTEDLLEAVKSVIKNFYGLSVAKNVLNSIVFLSNGDL